MTGWPFQARHLAKARLYECYLSDRSGEGVDPLAADHLAGCALCRQRLGALGRTLDELRGAADEDTRLAFTDEDLRAQRAAILARVGALDHRHRVLPFPAHAPHAASPAAAAPRTSGSRLLVRWSAAAAIAGLVVGGGAGFLYRERQGVSPALSLSTRPRLEVTASATVGAGISAAPAFDLTTDDDVMFMSEIEASLESPRTEELLAFEALTPHVQEVALRVR